MIRRLSGLALAGLLVSAAALPTPAASPPPDFAALDIQPYDPPKPAPDFALPGLDGKTVRLAGFKGQVLLLFFWATW